MLWCPCFMQCMMAKRMKENCLVPWFVPAGMIIMRTRMRSKLDIKVREPNISLLFSCVIARYDLHIT